MKRRHRISETVKTECRPRWLWCTWSKLSFDQFDDGQRFRSWFWNIILVVVIPFDTPNGSIQYCRNGSAAAGKWEKVEDRKRGEKREREKERKGSGMTTVLMSCFLLNLAHISVHILFVDFRFAASFSFFFYYYYYYYSLLLLLLLLLVPPVLPSYRFDFPFLSFCTSFRSRFFFVSAPWKCCSLFLVSSEWRPRRRPRRRRRRRPIYSTQVVDHADMLPIDSPICNADSITSASKIWNPSPEANNFFLNNSNCSNNCNNHDTWPSSGLWFRIGWIEPEKWNASVSDDNNRLGRHRDDDAMDPAPAIDGWINHHQRLGSILTHPAGFHRRWMRPPPPIPSSADIRAHGCIQANWLD